MEDSGALIEKLVEAGCLPSVAREVVNSLCPQTESSAAGKKYSVEFENRFWKPYPRTPVMSKQEAWKAWGKLNETERSAVISAVPKYVDWLEGQRRQKPDYPAVHACRFISQRRFEGFDELKKPPPDPFSPQAYAQAAEKRGKFYARKGSDQLRAWDEYRRHIKGDTLPRDRHGGWIVDSEWPPKIEETAA